MNGELSKMPENASQPSGGCADPRGRSAGLQRYCKTLQDGSQFTASEIARALAPFWSKRRILSRLTHLRPAGLKMVSGNAADSFTLAQLPTEIRLELESRARAHCCRAVADWLNDPCQPWQPAIPLARLHESCIQAAGRLKTVLIDVVKLPATLSVSERARLAGPAFAREFGRSVSGRHLRDLITRTMVRDAGLGAWDRLEIYLPDALKPKAQPSAFRPGSLSMEEVDDALGCVTDRNRPTVADIAFCWRAAVECYARHLAEGTQPKAAKRAIVAHLAKSAPFMGKTPRALKANLNVKIGAAEKGGIQALADKRATNSGNRRRAPEWEENIKLLARHARHQGARISQSWRELHLGTASNDDRFTQRFRDFYPFDGRVAKSEVPAEVRVVVRPMMNTTHAPHLGASAAKLARPSILRDWSDTAAGDFYTSDDVTCNHYFYSESEQGEFEAPDGSRFNVTRGQWLPVTDERTDYPLGFALLPTKNYNSWAIRTLNTRIFSNGAIGLPYRGMAYEKGIWRARNIAAQFSWAHVDEGFARHGLSLKIRHATTAKAKVIESVIGRNQNLMEHLPGWVGHDEKNVRYERMQKFLLRLKRVGQPQKAAVHPGEMMLSKAQFADELEKVLHAFAMEPQGGERIPGLSPAEAWKQLHRDQFHTLLPPSLRYLLSTNQSEQTVGNDGINIRIGRVLHRYVGSEQLGALIRERVRVFFNVELPEIVTVIHPASDPKGLKPFTVPLFERLPATTATPDQFARAREHQNAFTAYGRTIYRLMKPVHGLTLQQEGFGPPEARQLGKKINDFEREQIELSSKQSRSRGEISKLSRSVGIRIDASRSRDPGRVVSKLREAESLEAEIMKIEKRGGIK